MSKAPGVVAAWAWSRPRSNATTAGDTLLIVNRAGDPIAASLAVNPAAAQATSSQAATAIVTLGGVPIINDTWTISLTPDGGSATDYSFQVGLTGEAGDHFSVPERL